MEPTPLIIPPFIPRTFAPANSLFVSTTGNNGTGTRGNASLPYSTIAAAIAAAQPGDCIQVAAGTYQENGGCTLTADSVTGLHLAGPVAFPPVVIINSTRPLTGSNGPIVIPGNNSYVANLQINATAAPGTYQAPIGCRVAAGNDPSIGSVWYNIQFTGDSDGPYYDSDSPGGMTFTAIRCGGTVKWDAANLNAAEAMFIGGTYTATGPSPIVATQSRGFVSVSGGKITLIDVTVNVSGSTGSNLGLVAQTTGRIIAHNTTVNTSGTGAADISAGSGGSVSVRNCKGSGTNGALTGSATLAATPLNLMVQGDILADELQANYGTFRDGLTADSITLSGDTRTAWPAGASAAGAANAIQVADGSGGFADGSWTLDPLTGALANAASTFSVSDTGDTFTNILRTNALFVSFSANFSGYCVHGGQPVYMQGGVVNYDDHSAIVADGNGAVTLTVAKFKLILPTSASGLSSGQWWNNAGTPNIVA